MPKGKATLTVGKIDGGTGDPFTGVQIQLPDGNLITMQIRLNGPGGKPEGWISSSFDLEEKPFGDTDLGPWGTGHRFTIDN